MNLIRPRSALPPWRHVELSPLASVSSPAPRGLCRQRCLTSYLWTPEVGNMIFSRSVVGFYDRNPAYLTTARIQVYSAYMAHFQLHNILWYTHTLLTNLSEGWSFILGTKNLGDISSKLSTCSSVVHGLSSLSPIRGPRKRTSLPSYPTFSLSSR